MNHHRPGRPAESRLPDPLPVIFIQERIRSRVSCQAKNAQIGRNPKLPRCSKQPRNERLKFGTWIICWTRQPRCPQNSSTVIIPNYFEKHLRCLTAHLLSTRKTASPDFAAITADVRPARIVSQAQDDFRIPGRFAGRCQGCHCVRQQTRCHLLHLARLDREFGISDRYTLIPVRLRRVIRSIDPRLCALIKPVRISDESVSPDGKNLVSRESAHFHCSADLLQMSVQRRQARGI